MVKEYGWKVWKGQMHGGKKEGRRRIRDEDMKEMAFPDRLNLQKH
jgi:hypothetical protein